MRRCVGCCLLMDISEAGKHHFDDPAPAAAGNEEKENEKDDCNSCSESCGWCVDVDDADAAVVAAILLVPVVNGRGRRVYSVGGLMSAHCGRGR